jgi:hypothetical protein
MIATLTIGYREHSLCVFSMEGGMVPLSHFSAYCFLDNDSHRMLTT